MLEDELTYILAEDNDVKQLVIVDGKEQQELARKLRSQNRPFLIVDFQEAFSRVKKHRYGSGGHSIKRQGILQQLLRRRSRSRCCCPRSSVRASYRKQAP
jgi:hypothetical protein